MCQANIGLHPLIPQGLGGPCLRVLLALSLLNCLGETLAVAFEAAWPPGSKLDPPGGGSAPHPLPLCLWKASPSCTILQLAKKTELSGTRELGAEARYWLSKRNMKGWSMVWPKRKAKVKTLATRGSTLEQYPL